MPEVRNFISAVPDEKRKQLVTEVIDEFCATVLPNVDKLDQVQKQEVKDNPSACISANHPR